MSHALPLPGTRRRAWRWSAVVVLAALVTGSIWLAGGAGRRVRHSTKTNVLLICMDTARRDRLSCYGYSRETTPKIDQFAQDALLFERCVAVSNWTLPTHASILTGLYPTTHGAHLLKGEAPKLRHADDPFVEPAGAMSDKCQTLAETLGGRGYRTGAVVANAVYLQRAYQLDQGFEHYDDRCTCTKCRPVPSGGEPPVPYRQAKEISDEAISWLEQNDDRPFFLFLNFMDPHLPYFPPPPYDKKFRDEPSSRLEQNFKGKRHWMAELEMVRKLQQALESTDKPIRADYQSWLNVQYDGAMAYLDEHIGRLFDWLRREGLYENTMIVLTSDHGECFGEHRLLDHGYSLYESEIAVPLVVKFPNERRKGRSAAAVQQVDVMPTVLEELGVESSDSLQGRSLLTGGDRDVFVEKHTYSDTHQLHRWALYRDHLKLVVKSDGGKELYDLAQDPQEMANLAESQPQEVETLMLAISEWRARLVPISAAQPATNLRPGTDEQLKDLNYIQP